MTSEHKKELQRALVAVAAHGWWVKGVNPKTGYTTLYCSCDLRHSHHLPKTPSNRNTFRRRARQMIRTCSVQAQR